MCGGVCGGVWGGVWGGAGGEASDSRAFSPESGFLREGVLVKVMVVEKSCM